MSRDHISEDTASVDLQQDEAPTGLKSRECDGSGWCRTGLFGERWGQTMSSRDDFQLI